MVVGVRDIDVARCIDRQALGIAKLPVAGAQIAPLGKKGARGTELLDAVVVGVRHVDVARGIDRHAMGIAVVGIINDFIAGN